ncbi:MAG TPA: GAF domain-containing protein [Candidatus Acidoferrum sp.]|nr:GAF domain-containing protein [Candidatus Acidoferrum sp.]
MSTTLSLVSEMERIASALNTEQGDASLVSLSSVAQKIAKNLGVRNDEVAILAVSTRWRHLHFLVPEALKKVGFIPLSSNSALAARTARDSRPDIENNFAAARHATVFEGVKITGEAAEAIQKMISAPILLDGKVIGVIQVSRKGANPASAGPDFTADDLGKILTLCKPLGKMLHHVAGE